MVAVRAYCHPLRPRRGDLRMANGRRTVLLHDHAHAAVRSCPQLYWMGCPKISVMACRYSRVCMSCMSTCLQIKVRRNVQKVLRTSRLYHPSKNGAHPYPRSAHGPATWRSILLPLVRRLPVRFEAVVLSPYHHPPCFHFPAYLSTSLLPSQHTSPLHP